jgi:hypothetical protein
MMLTPLTGSTGLCYLYPYRLFTVKQAMQITLTLADDLAEQPALG